MIKAVIFDLDGVIAISDKRFSDRLGMSQELQDEFFKGVFLNVMEHFTVNAPWGRGHIKPPPGAM